MTRARIVALLLMFTLPAFAQKVDFKTDIRPIFESSCVSCHKQGKAKGRLRLDSRAGAHYAPEGDVIVPGKPEDSELYVRLRLPAGDEDLMPQDGDPLPKESIDLIRRWIEQGAEWPDNAGGAKKDPEAEWRRLFEIPALNESQQKAEQEAMERLKSAGALVERIASTTSALDVNLSLLGKKAGDDQLAHMAGLEPTLVWFNASRTAITDAGLSALASMDRLQRLNLSQTAITDAGLATLKGLKNLRYLNLYGTRITSAAGDTLASFPNLEKVYLWQTGFDDDAADKLAKAKPGLLVDTGKFALPPAPAAPLNARCPVTNAPIDPGFTLEYKGALIGFCCGKCLSTFQKDAAPYLKNLEGMLPAAAAVPVNAKCPVSGADVDPQHTLEHEGLVLGFCCEKCKAAFAKKIEGLSKKTPK